MPGGAVEKVEAVLSLPAAASSKEGFAELHALMPLLVLLNAGGIELPRHAWRGQGIARNRWSQIGSGIDQHNRVGPQFRAGILRARAFLRNAWALAGDAEQ
jgi:hypothetical protein